MELIHSFIRLLKPRELFLIGHRADVFSEETDGARIEEAMWRATWEEGMAYFRQFGYKNRVPMPATVIPQCFGNDKSITNYSNGFLITWYDEAGTNTQPENWKGEVQARGDWRENPKWWQTKIYKFVEMA